MIADIVFGHVRDIISKKRKIGAFAALSDLLPFTELLSKMVVDAAAKLRNLDAEIWRLIPRSWLVIYKSDILRDIDDLTKGLSRERSCPDLSA